ncbi:1-deoxy-D-xylulose-5-phosphate reductoisomerase [Rhodoferax lacus]|uniref:1-deoxy-D-xylulose 5-phosphate reductoisomerase n=1 Tax=Rhodoferax lacus TaxID=2184758 RepID=A0A3E1RCJ1_9BURK|nr:1-deoxy-D-xylulose-5-phosphate reductoisomerase [Rhodoferax lacus]RFO96941.1 1-deoxy-D-xylulose-5-phosphate reductoisomerase [Rhodoferax lacus]
MKQRIAILGSTGSIGVNTLEVLSLHPDHYEVFALTASTSVDALFAQCCLHKPAFAIMADAASGRDLKQRCTAEGLAVEVLWGMQAIADIAAHPQVDAVMAAIVGAAGLAPCMAAARSGKRLLLANKEALVVGGHLFMDAVQAGGATLLPIDSEHSAIFQSLPDDASTWKSLVDKIILTASGGPFRARAPGTLGTVTPLEACAHPNWVMGRKISVDSATMMNKALEVIEAKFLFGMEPRQIEVVIHPQSVIHSMVQFVDNSVVAQLGTPDMRGPIAYGLSWPRRIQSGASALDFTRLAALTFEPFSSNDHMLRYPGLSLAWRVLEGPDSSPAVLNAANEIAVDAFLNGRIRFDQIHHVNLETLGRVRFMRPDSLDALIALDLESRSVALGIAQGLG